jgi:hypothetical protein
MLLVLELVVRQNHPHSQPGWNDTRQVTIVATATSCHKGTWVVAKAVERGSANAADLRVEGVHLRLLVVCQMNYESNLHFTFSHFSFFLFFFLSLEITLNPIGAL